MGRQMARTVRDVALETRAARARLSPQGKPYYRTIEEGLHLGYRKPVCGAGKWVLRHYVGGRDYTVETIEAADDLSDADGVAILSYRQAQARARERMVHRAHAAAGKHGPLTVRDIVEAYLEWLEGNRKSAVDARHRARAHIYPTFEDAEAALLTTDLIRKWHVGLAKALPRARTKPGKVQQHRAFDGSAEAVRRRRSSANRVLTILKAALNHAFNDGKLPSDAAWRKVKPFRGVDSARIRYLSVAEAQRLLNACDPPLRPLVEAALQTGARYGELTRLQVHDYNADAGTIAIRQSKTGQVRHIFLTEEGIAFFDGLTVGRDGSAFNLHEARWRALAAESSDTPNGRSLRPRRDRNRRGVPRLAALLGEPRSDGRSAVASRIPEPWTYRHPNGREALWPPCAIVYRRGYSRGRTTGKVAVRR
jgi:integrase